MSANNVQKSYMMSLPIHNVTRISSLFLMGENYLCNGVEEVLRYEIKYDFIE